MTDNTTHNPKVNLRQAYKLAYRRVLQTTSNQERLSNLLDEIYFQSRHDTQIWTTEIDNAQLDLSRRVNQALRAARKALTEIETQIYEAYGVDPWARGMAPDGTPVHEDAIWRTVSAFLKQYQEEAKEEHKHALAALRAYGEY